MDPPACAWHPMLVFPYSLLALKSRSASVILQSGSPSSSNADCLFFELRNLRRLPPFLPPFTS